MTRLAASEFHTWAGMEVTEAAAGEVTVAMDVLDRHVNLQGLVHGGMLAILADTACGLSIRSAMEPGRLHVTTDLDIHYLAPAKPGTPLRTREGDQGGTDARVRRGVGRRRGRQAARASAVTLLGERA